MFDPTPADRDGRLPASATHDGEYQYSEALPFRTVSDATWESGPRPKPLRMGITWPNAKGKNLQFEGLKLHPLPRWPVVVIAHGGGWLSGDFEGPQRLAAALARRGLVCVSVDYRLPITGILRQRLARLRDMTMPGEDDPAGDVLDKASFPGAVRDVKAAVRLARAEIDHGLLATIGDPERIGVCGTSAGANLMAVVACTDESRISVASITGFGADYLEGSKEPRVTDREVLASGEFSSAADFATLISTPHPNLVAQLNFARSESGGTTGAGLAAYIGRGTATDPRLWAAASPRTYLVQLDADWKGVVKDEAGKLVAQETLPDGTGLPQFVLFHGEADMSTPYKGAQRFARFIRFAGGTVDLVSLGDKAGHGTWREKLGRIAKRTSELAYTASAASAVG